jgi:hypothetical protein
MTQTQHIVYISGTFNGEPESGWHGPFPNGEIAQRYANAITQKPGGRLVFVRVEPLKSAVWDHLVSYEDPRPGLDDSQAPVGSDWDAAERQHAALCVAAGRAQP